MAGSDRKYPGWGTFLKKNRLQKYRSAREFCARMSVGISYPQYSRYEAGDQLPNLDQALRLCQLLDIEVLEGILEWCHAQVSDEDLQAKVATFLGDVRNQSEWGQNSGEAKTTPAESDETNEAKTSYDVSLNDVIVFNRSHLRYFKSDPLYRDIFTYVNSFAPDWVTTEELAIAMKTSEEKIESLIEDLSEIGVLLIAGGRCRAAKKTFYFPDDEDYFEMRNRNLIGNTQDILNQLTLPELQEKKAYRAVVTRELTKDQAVDLVNSLEQMVEKMVTMSESKEPDTVYSLCLLLGERFSRRENIEKAQQQRISSQKSESLSNTPRTGADL